MLPIGAAFALVLLGLPSHALADVKRPSANVACERRDWNREPTEAEREAACLSQMGGLAVRRGSDLRLALASGRSKTFRDVQQGCTAVPLVPERCYKFELIGFRPAEGLYIVLKTYYEEFDVLLVSERTGREVVVATPPAFSPSGKRALSIEDTELGERRYELAVISLDGSDPARIDWTYKNTGPNAEYWTLIGWDGDDRIRLAVTTYVNGKAYENLGAELNRTGQGWVLTKPNLP